MDKLKVLLNFLDENIDVDQKQNVAKNLAKSLSYENIERPLIKRNFDIEDFTPYPYSETVTDMAKMMYNELLSSLCTIVNNDDGLPMIRTNYGVGTLASLFGLKSSIINENLPWVKHLDNISDIKKIIANGVPNLENGFGKKVIETYEFYNEVLKDFPKCREVIKLYHPDLQGPFDNAHLIMGSDIYLGIYDIPDLVEDLLQVVTETYIAFMKKIKFYINDEFDGYCYHWGVLFGGQIVLRDDSAVNLSSQAYKQFVQKYDEIILKEFKGGSIHFCGRADQWIFDMMDTENLKGLNFGYMAKVEFGQKYLDFIFPKLKEKKIPVSGYFLPCDDLKIFDFTNYKTGINYITN